MSARLADAFDRYQPGDDRERADVERGRALLAGPEDPFSRSVPLHVTGSALVVHPPSARVLLRWHDRQQAWLQVGGHADPGEDDPAVTALREGEEETGLTDLRPWPGPDAEIVQVVAVDVPPGKGEPAHEHLDVRYLLATDRPEEARPENPTAELRWLTVPEAMDLVSEENLRVLLRRLGL
jgi:8-oxo-dGTP pyrophosphatase MutT (NUDIX family)